MSALIKQAGSWAVNQFLSDILHGVTPDTFIIDFGAGEFGVKNVQLNLKHFQDIETPLDIKHVSLGDVRLTIPALWKLMQVPIKIKVEKLFIVLSANNSSKITIDERKAMMKATKKLALFVMGFIRSVPEPEEYAKKNDKTKSKLLEPELFGLPGIVKKLIPIVDNVQVEVANIHIRYEDAYSKPSSPFAVGVCLDKVSIVGSTTASGQNIFVTEWNLDNFRKVCLNNFSIYIDTEGKGTKSVLDESSSSPPPISGAAKITSEPLPNQSQQHHASQQQHVSLINLQHQMNSLIYRGPPSTNGVSSDHHFFVQPFELNATAQWHRGFDVNVPMIQADAQLPHLGMTVSHDQYSRVLDAATHYNAYAARLKFGYLAVPTENALTNPRAWWKFVIHCVRKRIRHRLKRYKPENIAKRLTDRNRYINLRRSLLHLGPAWVSSAEKKEMADLEAHFKFRDTMHFRAVAKLSLIRDVNTKRIPEHGFVAKAAPALKITVISIVAALIGLVCYAWLDFKLAASIAVVLFTIGIASGYKIVFGRPALADFDESPENWRWIYAQLPDWDIPKAKPPPQPTFPPSYSLVKFKANIPRIQADINTIGARPFDSSLLTLGLDGINASGSVGDPAIAVNASIDSINAVERVTLEKRQTLAIISHVFGNREEVPKVVEGEEPIPDLSSSTSDRFVNLKLDLKPHGRPNVDVGVVVRTSTFNVNVSMPLVNAMLGFFIPPANRATIEDMTKTGIHRVAVAAQDSIKAAVRDRQCIALDIHVAGPTITMAQNYKSDSSNTDAIFIHLGRITLNSNPKRAANPEAWTEADCFDLYEITAQDLSVALLKGAWSDPIISRRFAISSEKHFSEIQAPSSSSATDIVRPLISPISPARGSLKASTKFDSPEARYIIKPFSTFVKAFVCIAGNVPGLPATRLLGDVTPLDVVVSATSLHRIFGIMSAQFPPHLAKKRPPKVNTQLPKKKSVLPHTDDPSAEEVAEPRVYAPNSDLNDELAFSRYGQLKLPPIRSAFVGIFNIQSFTVDIVQDAIEGQRAATLASLAVNTIDINVDVSPYILGVDARVSSMQLEEFVDSTFKLVPTAPSSDRGEKSPSYILKVGNQAFGAVTVGLKVIPKYSPAFTGTMIDILVNIGDVDINIMRPAILCLMRQGLQFIPQGFVVPAFGVKPNLPVIVLEDHLKLGDVDPVAQTAAEAQKLAAIASASPTVPTPAQAPVSVETFVQESNSSIPSNNQTQTSAAATTATVPVIETSEPIPADSSTAPALAPQSSQPVTVTTESVKPAESLGSNTDTAIKPSIEISIAAPANVVVAGTSKVEGEDAPFVLEPIPVDGVSTIQLQPASDTLTHLNLALASKPSTGLTEEQHNDSDVEAVQPAQPTENIVTTEVNEAELEEIENEAAVLMQRENEATRLVGVRVNLPVVTMKLFQRKDEIVTVTVDRIVTAVDVRGDSALVVQGFINQFSLTAAHDKIGQVSMLAVEQGKLASFAFRMFPSNSSDYPDHDMAVEAAVGTLKLTYYHLVVMGLVNWSLSTVDAIMLIIEDIKAAADASSTATRRASRRSRRASLALSSSSTDGTADEGESKKHKKISRKKSSEIPSSSTLNSSTTASPSHTREIPEDIETPRSPRSPRSGATTPRDSSTGSKKVRKHSRRHSTDSLEDSQETDASGITDEDGGIDSNPVTPRDKKKKKSRKDRATIALATPIDLSGADGTLSESKERKKLKRTKTDEIESLETSSSTKKSSKKDRRATVHLDAVPPLLPLGGGLDDTATQEDLTLSSASSSLTTPDRKHRRSKTLRKSTSRKKKTPREVSEELVSQPMPPIKIKIDARIASPSIFIPINPYSPEGGSFVVHGGEIEIFNELNHAGDILTDLLTCNISHLHVIINMPENVQTPSQFSLLDHSALKATVQRVLSGDSKHSVPVIGVDVELTPLHIAFGTPQLDIVFQLLSKHILLPVAREHEVSEYIKLPTEDEAFIKAHEAKITQAYEVQARVAKWEEERDASLEEISPLKPAADSFCTVRVVLRISSVIIDLCDSHISPQLQIAVKQIGTLVAIQNDGYIAVEAGIGAIEVVDLVISYDHFNGVFGKPANVVDPMVTTAFVLNPNANAIGVNARVNSPVVALLPETILRLKDTWETPIMTGLKGLQSALPPPPSKAAIEAQEARLKDLPKIPSTAPCISCKVNIDSPMVAIVPGANEISTKAFAINLGEIAAAVELRPGKQQIDVDSTVSNLKLSRVIITAGSLLMTNEQHILHPMELKASMHMIEEKLVITALIPIVQFIASFNDVGLVMQLLDVYQPLIKALTPPPQQAKGTLDHSSGSAFSTTTSAGTSGTDDVLSSGTGMTGEPAAVAADKPVPPSMRISITTEITKIDVAFIDDRFKNEFFVPILRFNLSPLKGKLTKEEKTAGAFSFNGIESSVYNRDFGGWEPILEPWEMKFGFSQDEHGISGQLLATSILEVNVNQSLLVSIFELLEIVAPPKSKKKKSKAVQLRSADPLVVRNWSGLKATIQLSDGSEPFLVSDGESRPLLLKRQTRAEAIERPPKYRFSVYIDGASAPAKISANRVDTVVIPFKIEDPRSVYIAEIANIQGSRTITIRGTYKVINTTGLPLELLIIGGDGHSITVDPNGGVFSASMVQCTNRALKVRAHGYDWSEIIHFNQPKPAYILTCKQLADAGHEHTGFDWYGTAKVEVGCEGEDFTLVISPPVNVENLFNVPMQVKFVNLRREKEYAKAVAKEEKELQKAAAKEEKEKKKALKDSKSAADASATASAMTPNHSSEDLSASNMSLAASNASISRQERFEPVQSLSSMPTYDIVECDDEDIHSLPSFDDTLAICIKLPDFGWSKPTAIVNKVSMKRTDKFDSDLVTSKTVELPDSDGLMLKVGVDVATTDTAARNVKVYATSWVINDTGLPLFFKKDKDDSRLAAGQREFPGYEIRLNAEHSKKEKMPASPSSSSVSLATTSDILSTSASSISRNGSLLKSPNQHHWYGDNVESLIESTPTSSSSTTSSLKGSSVTLSESIESTPSSVSTSSSKVGRRGATNFQLSESKALKSVSIGYGPYFYFGEKRISIALENSSWSSSSDLGVRDEGTIDIEDASSGRLYSFFIAVRPAPARFWRTSIVRIYPRFVVSNTSTVPLILRQISDSHLAPTALRLEVGQRLPYHWPSYKKAQLMVAHVADKPHMCTAVFGLDQVGRFPLRFHDTSVSLPVDAKGKKTVGGPVPIPSLLDDDSFTFAGLNITNVGDSSIFVRFLDDSPDEFYSISNQCGVDIIIREYQDEGTDALKLLKRQKKEEAALAAQDHTEDGAQTEDATNAAATSSSAPTDTTGQAAALPPGAATQAGTLTSDSPAKSDKEIAKEKKAADKAAKEREKEEKKAADKAAKEKEKEEKRLKKTGAIDDSLTASTSNAPTLNSSGGIATDDAHSVEEASTSTPSKKGTSTKSKSKAEDLDSLIQVDEKEAEARGAQGYILKAKRKEAFMFPRPQFPKHRIEFQLAGDSAWHKINLDKIQVLPSFKLGSKKYLHMKTVAVGQSKQLIVRISHKKAKTDEEQLVASDGSKMSFELKMAGVGVSIVDQTPQELMYLRMADLTVIAGMSSIEQNLEVKLGMLQVDNDLYLTPQPIILHSLDQPDGDPFFHLAMVRDLRYQKFFCFRYFSMKMHKLASRLDMAFAMNAMCWALNLSKWLGQRTSAETEHNVIIGEGEGKIKTPILRATDNGFYFEVFHLNPMAFQISFTPSSNFDCPNIDDAGAEMIAKISPHLVTIDEAPLLLGGLLMTNIFTTQEEFIARITAHYIKSVLKQLLFLVGSTDALGNPVSLVNSLGTGVYDLVHEPAAGATQSPAQFGIGIAKGTGSLLKNSLGGVLATAEKLVGNVSKLGEKLTMDKDYQQEREKMKLKKAHHIGTGLSYGFKELGTGLFQGVAGLVTQPVKGAKSKGLKGFATGIGKGLVGVVVKPTVGVVDLVTRTTEGLRNTGSDHKAVPRVRDPRYIGADQILTLYDPQKAEGQLFLRTLTDGKYRKEFYVWHMAPTSKSMVLVTNNQIMYLKVHALEKIAIRDRWGIKWRNPTLFFSEKIDIDDVKKRVILYERTASESSAAPPGNSTSLVPPTADEVSTSESVMESQKSPSKTSGTASPSTSTSTTLKKALQFRIKYAIDEDAQTISERLLGFIREAPVKRPRAKALSLLSKIGGFNPLSPFANAASLVYDKRKKKEKALAKSSSEASGANSGEDPLAPSATTLLGVDMPADGIGFQAVAPTESLNPEALRKGLIAYEAADQEPTATPSKKDRRRSVTPTTELAGDSTTPLEGEEAVSTPSKREKVAKRSETLGAPSSDKELEKEKEKRKAKREHSLNIPGTVASADSATSKSPRKDKKDKKDKEKSEKSPAKLSASDDTPPIALAAAATSSSPEDSQDPTTSGKSPRPKSSKKDKSKRRTLDLDHHSDLNTDAPVTSDGPSS